MFWVIHKFVRILFGRFLFLCGAKCQVSSVMMPASLLLQLTLFTRLKFKNRLDIIYRTHLKNYSPKIFCKRLCSAFPLSARSVIFPCGSMRMLSGMASILYTGAAAHCQPFRSEICSHGIFNCSMAFIHGSFFWSNETPTTSNPLSWYLLYASSTFGISARRT